MTRAILLMSGFLLGSLSPNMAFGQYGYPGGYGGYGWGGWGTGSTVGGSLASGLGYFNLGRGAYNYDTAAARSINADTVMRWNEYLYQSQREATRRYHAIRDAKHARAEQARAEIADRLRNHPETRDITNGDALNVLLEELLNPAAGSMALRIQTPIRHDVIPDIPFEYATEGVTICLDQMTLKDQWPLALRVEEFRPEREALRKALEAALEEDKEGNLEPKTIESVQQAIDRLRIKFDRTVPKDDSSYIESRDRLKAIAGLTRLLYSPKVEQIIAELEDYQGTTLGDLVGFMQAFNLRFAPANSFRQRQIYLKLYAMLAEQVNGTGSLGSSAMAAAAGDAVKSGAQAVSGVGRRAVESAEGLGSKAYDGLKSAATDFFKEMDWSHLSGGSSTRSPAPMPPTPATPK
jgi:hypothetical protein